MTDAELNDKIARLLGWKWKKSKHCWLHPCGGGHCHLPDYLGRSFLPELLDLAKGAGYVGLCWSDTAMGHEAMCGVDSDWHSGPTFSHALARAIVVAFKEAEQCGTAAEVKP